VRVEEEVADVFPGTLFSGPGPEELNWKTVGLRPATTVLQSLVEPPSQVISSFVIHDLLSFKCIVRACNLLPHRIPLTFPTIHSDTADGINVDSTSDSVMTEDSRLKENSNSVSAASRYVASEPIEYALQLMSEFGRDQCADWGRVDAKISPRTNRHSDIGISTWS
jgi:hypothetical protein